MSHLNFSVMNVMKKIVLCLVLIILYLSVLSQDKYIYDEYGDKYYFIENSSTKYVKFENVIPNKNNINILSALSSNIDTISNNFYRMEIETRNISLFYDKIRKMDSVLYSNELYMLVIQQYNVVSIKYC